jgi:hypothetical protein
MCDTTHHGWHPTGLMSWNGTGWVPIPNVTITGNEAVFSSRDIYSAIAFIGAPANPTSVTDQDIVPSEFLLEQNYPNPFNPSTTIAFSIPQTAHVTLDVFNTAGEKVALLVSQEMNAGSYRFMWNASGLASGVYFYRLQAGEFTEARKLLLVK